MGHPEICETFEEVVGRKARQGKFWKKAAPSDIARVRIGGRWAIDDGARDGCYSISTNDEVGNRFASVSEAKNNMIGLLAKMFDFSIEQIRSIQHPLPKDTIDVVPRYLCLRRHLLVHGRSRIAEHDAVPRNHPDAGHVLASRGAQNGKCLAPAQQAGAAPFEPMDRSLVNGDVVSILRKQRCRE
jgi:hypothetical protein